MQAFSACRAHSQVMEQTVLRGQQDVAVAMQEAQAAKAAIAASEAAQRKAVSELVSAQVSHPTACRSLDALR